MSDMAKIIRQSYIGKPVRINYVVGSQEFAWVGKIESIRDEYPLITFRHCESDRKELGVATSILDLSIAAIFAIDDVEEQEPPSIDVPPVAMLQCPHCQGNIYIVDTVMSKKKGSPKKKPPKEKCD